MICLFLYYQFHAEASLGGLLHDLTALRGERGAVGVAQWRGGHLFHHEVEGGDAKLLQSIGTEYYGLALKVILSSSEFSTHDNTGGGDTADGDGQVAARIIGATDIC